MTLLFSLILLFNLEVRAEELFPETLLKDFLKWDSVLPNDGSFTSAGHGGILVRAYFNEIAKPTYLKEQALPFKEGAIVAKAVIKDNQTSSANASRIYLMRKMGNNYDPSNNNWAYAFADLKDGKYVFNSQIGKVGLCIDCHKKQAQYDYLQTLKIFAESH